MARGAELYSQSGVIEAVARTQKSFKIGEDWFSVFNASDLGGAQAGDEVEFEYSINTRGGKDFLNVEGSVTIKVEGSGGRAQAPQRQQRGAPSSRRAPASRGATGSRSAGASAGSPTNDPRQRSIVRQNSLTQANALFATLGRAGLLGDTDAATLAEEIVDTARIFEKYSMAEDE